MPGSGGPEEPGTTTEESCSAPVRGLRWRRVFPGEDRQLGVLRRWLATLLPDGPLRDDVTAIASELAGNAIVHTASGRGGWFAVEIAWHHHLVRVAVADCGATGAPRLVEDPDGEHGRGLLVVRGLSVRSGVCGDQVAGWCGPTSSGRSQRPPRRNLPGIHTRPRSVTARPSWLAASTGYQPGSGAPRCNGGRWQNPSASSLLRPQATWQTCSATC